MKRCTRWLGVGCLSVAAWALSSPDVVAGHGSWGSGGGSYGGGSFGGGSSGGSFGGSSGGWGGWYGGSSGGGSSGGGWYSSHGGGGSYGGGSYGGGSYGGGSYGGGSYGGGSSGGGYHGGGGYQNGGGHHHGDGYVSRGYGVRAPAYASTRSNRYYNSDDTRVARVVVRVPADAKVYLQDQPMSLSGRVRRFVSPALRPGAEYNYTVRVEIERDGKTLSKTTDARVRAGQRVEVAVSFDNEDPTQLVSSVQTASTR